MSLTSFPPCVGCPEAQCQIRVLPVAAFVAHIAGIPVYSTFKTAFDLFFPFFFSFFVILGGNNEIKTAYRLNAMSYAGMDCTLDKKKGISGKTVNKVNSWFSSILPMLAS